MSNENLNDESTPIVPSGENPENTSASSAGQPNPFPAISGSDGVDPWYAYAQQMFPNTMVTPEEVAGLKQNMMQMISTTISEINARHATANQYNQQVAQGDE